MCQGDLIGGKYFIVAIMGPPIINENNKNIL